MPDFDDSQSSEGATNVSLHQRAATAPFAREVVNIQGDENAGRAIGFDMAGKLTTLLVGGEGGGGPVELADIVPIFQGKVIGRKSLYVGPPEEVSVSEMIALDPAAAKTALGKIALGDMANLARGTVITRVSSSPNPGVPEAMTLSQLAALDPESLRVTLNVVESPFVMVDTQAEFDAALGAGRSMVLRGEGTGGVITLTTPKAFAARGMVIQGATGGEELRFGSLAPDAHAITINADDLTLRNFKLTSTLALGGSNTQIGIYLPVGSSQATQKAQRLRISNVEMANWHTCATKHGGVGSPLVRDMLIEDCYWHSSIYGGYLTFGFERLTIRRSRFLMKLDGETHTPENAMTANGVQIDLLVEDCIMGQCGRMGLEMTTVPGAEMTRPRVIRTRVYDVDSCGVSFGHCVQGYGEGIIVDGSGGHGIELAGSDAVGRIQAVLVACAVKNVISTGPAVGITVDKAYDCSILGCRIENVTSVPSNESQGIYVYAADRTIISNCTFVDGGCNGVHVYRGIDPNTGGFHIIQGCSFRHTVNVASQRAVYVSDHNVIVRHNTSFQRPSGTMSYEANCTAGAGVICDDTSPALVAGTFTGTNRVVNVPA